jgi:acetyl/propionyl-CoA carboxylase alpha subunit
LRLASVLGWVAAAWWPPTVTSVNVLRHDALSGDTSTDFIERYRPARERHVSAEVRRLRCGCARRATDAPGRSAGAQHHSPVGGIILRRCKVVRFMHRDEEIITQYRRNGDGSFIYDINGHRGEARIIRSGDGRFELEIDGVQRTLSVVRDGLRHWVQSATGEVRLIESPRFPEPEMEHVAGGYAAPMPGSIVAVNVEPGQRVSTGAVLIIVEAMKMEHLITCGRRHRKEVRVTVGRAVEPAGKLVADTGRANTSTADELSRPEASRRP